MFWPARLRIPNGQRQTIWMAIFTSRGIAWIFPKVCTNYFPHPPPPTSKPQIISRYHSYDLRLFHQWISSPLWKLTFECGKSILWNCFFFKSLSFMNFISYSLFYYQYIIWFFPLNFLRYKSAYHVYRYLCPWQAWLRIRVELRTTENN